MLENFPENSSLHCAILLRLSTNLGLLSKSQMPFAVDRSTAQRKRLRDSKYNYKLLGPGHGQGGIKGFTGAHDGFRLFRIGNIVTANIDRLALYGIQLVNDI